MRNIDYYDNEHISQIVKSHESGELEYLKIHRMSEYDDLWTSYSILVYKFKEGLYKYLNVGSSPNIFPNLIRMYNKTEYLTSDMFIDGHWMKIFDINDEYIIIERANRLLIIDDRFSYLKAQLIEKYNLSLIK